MVGRRSRLWWVVPCVITALTGIVWSAAAKEDDPPAATVTALTLAPDDQHVLAERFKQQIWPMLTRGEKSCFACHDGSNGAALTFPESPDESFLMLLREGYLSAENPVSLLARITAPDDDVRMPEPPAKPWPDKDVQVLRAFYNDLFEKADRYAKSRNDDGVPADERFPAELLAPYRGESLAVGLDNTFISYTQLQRKIATIFGDDWHRGGTDLFKENIHMFGGADFQRRFNESTKASASFLTALEVMARDVASFAYLNQVGPFAWWDDDLRSPLDMTEPDDATRRAISRLYRRILFRRPTEPEMRESFALLRAVHQANTDGATDGYELAFALTATSVDDLTTTYEFTLPVLAEALGLYQESIDQSQMPPKKDEPGKDEKVARKKLAGTFTFKKNDPRQTFSLSNTGTHGNVSLRGLELRGPLPADTVTTFSARDESVNVYGAWGLGKDHCSDGNQNKGDSSIVMPIRVEQDGTYELTVLWPASRENASGVPIEVFSHDDNRLASPAATPPPPPGEARFTLDQTIDTEPFVDLRTAFRFASPEHYVEINNTGTTRLVTADAVKFIPTAGGAPLLVDNPEAENADQWATFKSSSFRAYNRVGEDSLSDKDKKKGELSIRYRPSAAKDKKAFDPAAHYRVAIAFPAKKDHETHTPVVIKAAASSPIVELSRPPRANVGARVTLDASGSYTVQGGDLTYRWRQKSGPRITLHDPTEPRLTFVTPRRDPTQDAWEQLAAALVQHPDFLFTRPPSLAHTTGPAERRRLQLVKIAQDLVGRAPTADELRDIDAGVSLESAVDYYLSTKAFEEFYFHRIRLYLESHGSTVQDEPVRLWCYVAFNDRPLTEILDAEYTVDVEMRRQARPAEHGKTGLLTMPGFIEGKPGLPHFNYAALVAEKFLGYVFEVPPEIVNMREAITAVSTTNPNTVCYSCHKILTPLAHQRLAWDDNGKFRAKNKDGEPIVDTDRGLVPSYPFKGKGMGAFAVKANRMERFLRTMINAHHIFYQGRELRHADDERVMYKRLWDTLVANNHTFRSLIKGIMTSPEYLNGGTQPPAGAVATAR